MSKFITRAAFVAAVGYSGALAMTQRGQLWDALLTRLGLTSAIRTTVTATGALTVNQCGPLQVDATAGNVVLTLPASGAATDEAVYEIDRIDATAYTVTVVAAGADTIDGAASVLVTGTMTLRLPAGSTVWRVHSISGATPAKARKAIGVGALRKIDGMGLSTAGGSATMSIAAGNAMDSTRADLMVLTAIAKTTAAWALGTAAGGLDTGAIATSTWYYFYAIRRPDTGVVDVTFSLSSAAPALPAAYTQHRYLGAGFTDGAGAWTAFTQTGDCFKWGTPVLDVSAANSVIAVTTTLSVPRGRKMLAETNVYLAASFGNDAVYLSDLSLADVPPTATVAPLATITTPGGAASVMTNTSAQIRRRGSATTNINIATTGWIDRRDQE